MTACLRRWTRRGQSNHLSYRLAAVWRHSASNLGSIKDDLLGQNRLREMVALALLLKREGQKDQWSKVYIIYLIRR
jgi:hypothetical protein